MNTESKTLQLSETAGGRILAVAIHGHLDKSDFEAVAPEVERLIRTHGKIRILVDLIDFHGWTAGGLWEGIKFDLKHFAEVERVAIVGDKTWERGMAAFCKPFTKAQVKFFGPDERDEARLWVADKLPA